MTHTDDLDAAVIAERYPALKRAGERVKVDSGPFAGPRCDSKAAHHFST